MTKPRRVIPGVSYLISRRCSERRFFLRPDPKVTHIFEYLLAVLAARYGVEIHAFVLMSNHYHLVITDTRGRLPDFERDLNSALARSINAFRGRWESFWDRDSYSAVELLGDADMLAKMAYTLVNPVHARLVSLVWQWEGASSAKMRFGRGRRIERPKGFFRDTMPAVATLKITRPECKEIDGGVFETMLRRQVRAREDAARHGGTVMGMKRVMQQDWNRSPKSYEEKRGVSPRIACKNKWVRIQALQRSAAWLQAYAEARAEFVRGNREVEFPPGTWWMCTQLGCRVAAT